MTPTLAVSAPTSEACSPRRLDRSQCLFQTRPIAVQFNVWPGHGSDMRLVRALLASTEHMVRGWRSSCASTSRSPLRVGPVVERPHGADERARTRAAPRPREFGAGLGCSDGTAQLAGAAESWLAARRRMWRFLDGGLLGSNNTRLDHDDDRRQPRRRGKAADWVRLHGPRLHLREPVHVAGPRQRWHRCPDWYC